MTINAGLFTSKTNSRATPQDFFNRLNEEFNLELDVCAIEENAKCERYYSKEIDKGVCWLNSPYGREIGEWLKKAYESS